MSFETEYLQRIRRAVGVYDDETDVIVDEHMAEYWDSGCDTCGYGRDEYSVDVTVIKWVDHDRVELGRRSFDSMSSFLDAVLKADIED